MATTAKEIEKYISEQTKELEQILKDTGTTGRKNMIKRRPRTKYLVASSNIEHKLIS